MGREEDSGWGTHVYLWQIHFDIWLNQYNIVKFKKKKKKKCEKLEEDQLTFCHLRSVIFMPPISRDCLSIALSMAVNKCIEFNVQKSYKCHLFAYGK